MTEPNTKLQHNTNPKDQVTVSTWEDFKQFWLGFIPLQRLLEIIELESSEGLIPVFSINLQGYKTFFSIKPNQYTPIP